MTMPVLVIAYFNSLKYILNFRICIIPADFSLNKKNIFSFCHFFFQIPFKQCYGFEEKKLKKKKILSIFFLIDKK